MKCIKIGMACLAMACLLVASRRAAATTVYVDATHGAGNTEVAASAGGGTFNPSGPLDNQGPANDGLWDLRAFGNSGTIYQNAGTGAVVDDAQRLVTSVPVPAGTYNVFAYFWSDNSNAWRLRAGLTDGALPLYVPGDAGVTQFYTGSDATVLSSTLSPNPFTSNVMIAEGNRRLYQIALGQTTGSSITVFVDDMGADQVEFNQRSWYDGIGYTLVPEPAAGGLAILAMAGLTGAMRRRGAVA